MAQRIGFLGVGPDTEPAWEWLISLLDAAPRRLALDALPTVLPELDVLWLHATAESPPLPSTPLRAWLALGGRLLLTQRAATRVVALGLEADGPNAVETGVWRHADDALWPADMRAWSAFPHLRGIAGFGPHPLFAGLGQGTYTWAPVEGESFAQATYARGRRPAQGAVVGCERAYIQLNADCIVAWEYAVDRGGVLCVGAFVTLGTRDPLLARQARRLLGNALAGAIPHAGRAGPAVTWPLPARAARRDPGLALPAALSLDGGLPGLESPLLMSSRALTDAPLALAGRRVLVTGGEQSGIREIWAHPWRVLRDLRVTIGGQTPLVRDAQIAPGVWQRHLVSATRIVEETVTTALEHAIVLLEYRTEKIGRAKGVLVPPELELGWMVDLRRMWPYAADAGGDLRWRVGEDGRVLRCVNGAGTVADVIAGGPLIWDVRAAAADGLPRIAVRVRATLEEPLRLALVAGGGAADGAAARGALERRGVTWFSRQRSRHESEVREQGVRLRVPDPALGPAFAWARQRLDAFLVDTPGLGRSLVAGHAPARPGWGDGRPGYAWYFGRDACWTALALLAAGDFTVPRLVLRFLAATQDVSGKAIHEYATSGLAHYDAADSTPLFLLLAARYVAWTGDRAAVRDLWDTIRRAYRFCRETDTDGDSLIENTRVGHGWIEMGPLGDAHATLYLAGIWAAALEGLAPVARAVGDEAFAAELTERAVGARAALARFATADGWALGLLPDGSLQEVRTALTAVPLLLGAIDPATAQGWFDAIAGPTFTTPWGVRLLATTDPRYEPAGYHTGAVWPLYTGWTSLAEYRHHRGAAAWAHLAANARLPFARQLGGFDEVLRGDREEAAGVCPDQAWSAAMVVWPAIEGMLGVQPDAPAGRVTLAPHLPDGWGEAEWRGVRVGGTALDVRIRAYADHLAIRLVRTMGPPLTVTVSPALPAESALQDARVDEVPLAARLEDYGACRHATVTFDARDTHDVEVWFRPRGG